MASTALVRLLAASEGASTAMITLPDEHASPTQAAPAVDRLVNEADISLGAARLLVAAGALPRRDSRTLIEAARDGYSRMAAAEGQMPSPWFSSVVLGDGADASDVMVVDPAEGDPSESAVIFLHGFGGNLGLPCWQFAQAVADAGGMTVCPSIGTQGDWWTPRGQRIVEQTIAYLRQRGQKKIFLAGLSNGAAGASVLAPRLRRDLAGLVLISGASRRAGPAHVPALIVHGRSDSMMPPSLVRAYVHRAGRDAQYVEVDGGHFVLLDHADEVRRAVAAWLRREMDRGR